MAAGGTGPRRQGRMEVGLPMVYAAPSPPPPPPPGDTTWHTGTEGLLGGKAARAAVAVSAVVHSVNLFTRPVVLSDPEALTRGRRKTWIFAALFVVSVLALAITTFTQPQTYRDTVTWPTWAKYVEIEQYAPQCTCSNIDTTIADISTVRVPPWANFSSNFCSALMPVVDQCAPTANGTQSRTCLGTNAAVVLFAGYLESLSIVCYEFATHFDATMDSVATYPLGPLLLDNATLANLVYGVTLGQLRAFLGGGQASIQPLSQALALYLAPGLDVSVGATNRYPPNCTCRDALLSPSPAAQMNAPCVFQSVVDTRPPATAFQNWTCMNARDALYFPVQLLLLPETYAMLGMAPPYEQYTQFTGAERITPTSSFTAVMLECFANYFIGTGGGFVSTTALAPGFLTYDYAAHFATCRPSACTYVYDSRPSAAAGITAMLGLISGLNTVLTLAVDRVYDLILKPRPVAASPSPAGSDDSDDDAPAA